MATTTKLKFIYGQYSAERAMELAVNGTIVFSGLTHKIYVDRQSYALNMVDDILPITGHLTDIPSGLSQENLVASITSLNDKVNDLIGGMRFNGGTADGNLSLNTETNDIRPGDMYTATGEFTVGTMTVESGDLVVYKGPKVTEVVQATPENVVVVERETDNMVTAAESLTADLIVLGDGGKTVKTSGLSIDLENTPGTTTISNLSTNDSVPTSQNVYDAIHSLNVNVVVEKPNTFTTVDTTVSEDGETTTFTIGNTIGEFKTGAADVHDPHSPNYTQGLATVEDVQRYIEERLTWYTYEVNSEEVRNGIEHIVVGGSFDLLGNADMEQPVAVKQNNE